MKVILQEKVRHLGDLGSVVNVKPGFARNYLIPQGKALLASKQNLASFETRRQELEKIMAAKLDQAMQRQQALTDLGVIKILAKAGEAGKLFGSIGTRDIAMAISQAGVPVEQSEVRLPEGALRMLGDYEVSVELGGDLAAVVKLAVTAEEDKV